MARRMGLMIIFLLLILGIVFGLHFFRVMKIKQFVTNFQRQAPAISTQVATEESWQLTLSEVGTLTAVNGVDVSSEVPGQIVAIYFASGEMVKKGQSLIQLDNEVDQQTFKADQAALNLNLLNYNRQLELLKTHSTSQSAVDQAKSQLDQSRAAVATAQAQISKKNIKAPFSGKIGIRQVNIGQYITPGQPLVTLQALDPLYVDFSVPEQQFFSIYVGQPLHLTVDELPQVFAGKIIAINSKIASDTRMIDVRGQIPNSTSRLLPGLFTSVQVLLPKQEKMVAVPQTAIVYSLHGDSVYVIVPKGKDPAGQPILLAEPHFVTLGPRYGDKIGILKGIKAGDEVVISGQQKLQPNMRVVINNTVRL